MGKRTIDLTITEEKAIVVNGEKVKLADNKKPILKLNGLKILLNL